LAAFSAALVRSAIIDLSCSAIRSRSFVHWITDIAVVAAAFLGFVGLVLLTWFFALKLTRGKKKRAARW
jgi:hypothetical protein